MKIMRALRMDYAVDPRIASMFSDLVTARVVMQISLYSVRRQKEQILDATGEVDVTKIESSTVAATLTGKAAGQVASAAIIKAVQAIEAESGDAGTDPETTYKTGMEHMAAGRYADAIDSFAAALRVTPKNVQYRFGLASAYEAAKQYQNAGMEYRRVTDLDNENAKAWAGRGRCLLALGDSENAVGYLNEAIKLGIDSVDIHFALGEALIAQGLVAQGEAELGKAEEMAPNDLDTTLRMGASYEKANQIRRALDLYGRYAAKNRNIEIETRLARLNAAKGAYANALEHYTAAAAIASPDGIWKITEGATYDLLGQTLDALAKQILSGSDTALSDFDDDKLARGGLIDKLNGLKSRAESLRKSVAVFAAPVEYASAHSHRVYAMGLLLQAAIAYVAYAETDKDTQREQGLLMRNEAVSEIEAAQKPKTDPAESVTPEGS
jgi:tetratricopeptide (TPR) repeat protein